MSMGTENVPARTGGWQGGAPVPNKLSKTTSNCDTLENLSFLIALLELPETFLLFVA